MIFFSKSLLRRLFAALQQYIEAHPSAWEVYIFLLFIIYKARFRLLLLKDGRRYIALNKIILRRRNEGRCHILGNGSSVLTTMDLINADDFVIAINQGAILPTRIDILLTESGPDGEKREMLRRCGLSEADYLAWFRFRPSIVMQRNPKAVLILKNTWPGNLPPSVVDPDNLFVVLPEFLCSNIPQSRQFLRFVIQHILFCENHYIGQLGSSVLTGLCIAIKMGYDEIFIHGLDGQGSHFFHDKAFDTIEDPEYRRFLRYIRKVLPPVPNDQYPAGTTSISLLPLYVEAASKYGVTIQHARELYSVH